MRFFIVLALTCSYGVAYAGGGFVREPRGGYAKLYYSELRSRAYFTLDGTRRDDGQQLRQSGLTLYAEYGIVPHLQLATSVPVLRVNRFSGSQASSGLGDIAVELKAGIALDVWFLALAVSPELPTGRSRAFVALEDGGVINLPTGDGELNVWIRAAGSRSWPALRTYTSLELGYNLRTRGFTDQVSASIECGHQLLAQVWLYVRARTQQTLGGSINANVPFLYGEGTELVAFDAGAAIPVLSAVFVTLDYSNIAAARRNVYGGSILSAGMAATW